MAFTDNLTQEKLKQYAKVASEVLALILYTIYLSIEGLYYLLFPPNLKSLAGEVILITGSANGIGRQICLRLANMGATLVCWDIQQSDNDKLVEDLKSMDTKAFAYEIDVGDRSQVETVSTMVKQEVGSVTMIINNAAIMPCHSFLSHKPREIERAFQVNVLAHFWILREFLPAMIEKKHGHIVTVCSAAGIIPTRNLVPYCGTKHAVNGYIESLKEELRLSPEKPNINFTTVYPFSCQTDLIKNITCNSRFPSIYPILKPETVAEKLVDGIRRNYENIYVPGPILFAGIMARILPPKAQAAGSDFFDCSVEPQE